MAMAACLIPLLIALGVLNAGADTIYEPVDFRPASVAASEGQTIDLIVSDELERTPRHYLRIVATVNAEGPARVALVLEDVLRREHASETVELQGGDPGQITMEVEQAAGRPVSMIRAVRLRHEGAAAEVSELRLVCADESVPAPDVTVTGPRDETSIQQALVSLGDQGGVVYVPAGEYVLGDEIVIPTGNLTIYGDGRDTIIQGTWVEAKGLFKATKLSNLRFTRLHLRSLPITHFRGYNEQQHVQPGDAGKPSVLSRGITLEGCENVRVDHCEVELFGHAGVIFYGGTDNLVDHCFLHENFRYGYGYGVATPGTQELYIEDNNFENHRHGIAGNAGGASYIARFNRLVKDAAVLPGWNQNEAAVNQLRAHEIDAHAKCGWIYAHDNYVAMRNAIMGAGAMMRGNPGWLYRNVFESCSPAIYCIGNSDEVWTWDNEFVGCPSEEASKATGQIYFGQKPEDFKEFPYPHHLNRLDWWPGARSDARLRGKEETLCAGPAEPAVLRLVKDGEDQ